MAMAAMVATVAMPVALAMVVPVLPATSRRRMVARVAPEVLREWQEPVVQAVQLVGPPLPRVRLVSRAPK